MQTYFNELADFLTGKLQTDEIHLSWFSGEDSDFVRLNRSAIRQAGSVQQRYLMVDLVRGRRHIQGTVGVSGDAEIDRPRLEELLADLRAKLPHVPEDPYLLYSTDVRSSSVAGEDQLPDPEYALDAILQAGKGHDLVGIFAGGGVFSGFANSLGQRNWFASYSFNFDWSFYYQTDKAVKSNYAGQWWERDVFAQKVETARQQLAILNRPAKTVPPGHYQVYLAPAAVEEFLTVMSWGGFGLKAHRTKTTCLLKMLEEGATLSPNVSLRENTREGLAPNFQSAGYILPDSVKLIERGRLCEPLVSPRSAKEYGVPTNGSSEYPQSLDMAPGDLAGADVLSRLGTGVYVNQLWYLNFSDRPACRLTGMTRFATFWVENGQIVAPLNVMRFDETAYRVLGENLLALTVDRDFIPSTSTYGGRSTSSMRVPGALVRDFAFTL